MPHMRRKDCTLMKRVLTILLVCATHGAAIAAEPGPVFVSASRAATVVELFTSEGCSSCPPAERWLSRLKQNPRLWHDLVPLAFHVDYWNDLGWRDKFSDPANSLRQRRYKAAGHLGSVYTPGIVVNGREWRGFFNPAERNSKLPRRTSEPGILVLTRRGDSWQLRFKGDSGRRLIAHIAWIGMNLQTHVARGENAGKTLAEDFVILEARAQDGNGEWLFTHLPKPAQASAISAWLSAPDDPTPIQAVGGVIR